MSYQLTRKMHDLLDRCETYIANAIPRLENKDFEFAQDLQYLSREIRDLLKEAST